MAISTSLFTRGSDLTTGAPVGLRWQGSATVRTPNHFNLDFPFKPTGHTLRDSDHLFDDNHRAVALTVSPDGNHSDVVYDWCSLPHIVPRMGITSAARERWMSSLPRR